MKDVVISSLKETLLSLYQSIPEGFSFAPPREESYGDYSTNVAFLLAKEIRKSPEKIALEIVSNLPQDSFYAEAVKGFVNFRVKPELLRREFEKLLREGESYFFKPVEKSLYIQIEFVSANPTGPLHVGHGRGAVVGDVLSKILQKF
ncbi:MAG: arginine--tRNA ligase, partial [Aquificaceae bacterium]|nr:arginine--tRNA ligase [Aquificaceae bacterium]